MNFSPETEQETDDRWIADIPEIPGVMTYGHSREQAIVRVRSLALRVQQSAGIDSITETI